jgi:hypothetical protein
MSEADILLQSIRESFFSLMSLLFFLFFNFSATFLLLTYYSLLKIYCMAGLNYSWFFNLLISSFNNFSE